jgi:hypothetical protein
MTNIWYLTKEKLPTTNPSEQADVIFCSPGWATAIRGMFTKGDDQYPDEWSSYDQQEDRFYLWGKPDPELWMYFPEVPECIKNEQE